MKYFTLTLNQDKWDHPVPTEIVGYIVETDDPEANPKRTVITPGIMYGYVPSWYSDKREATDDELVGAVLAEYPERTFGYTWDNFLRFRPDLIERVHVIHQMKVLVEKVPRD